MYDTITTVKLWGARPRHWCYVMWDWHETTSTHAVGGACNTLKFLSQLVPPIRSEGVLIVLFAFWSAWRRSIQASTCATTCLHWLVGHMSQMKHYSELTLTNRTPCGTSTKHEKSWKCLLILVCIVTTPPREGGKFLKTTTQKINLPREFCSNLHSDFTYHMVVHRGEAVSD